MLSTVISVFGGQVIDKIFGGALDLFKQYMNNKITEAELKTQLLSLLIGAFKEIEIAHADALTKTYQTFWTAADTDKTNLMKIMWAAATASQIWVLFWSQWVVPMLYAYGWLGEKGWHAGTSAEWAYLLLGALLGMGPMVLRSGPASGTGIMGSLKALIGK